MNRTEILAAWIFRAVEENARRLQPVEVQSHGEHDFNIVDQEGFSVGLMEATAAIHENSMRSIAGERTCKHDRTVELYLTKKRVGHQQRSQPCPDAMQLPQGTPTVDGDATDWGKSLLQEPMNRNQESWLASGIHQRSTRIARRAIGPKSSLRLVFPIDALLRRAREARQIVVNAHHLLRRERT